MAQPIDLKKWVELGAAKEAGEVAALVACALAVGAAEPGMAGGQGSVVSDSLCE